MKRRLERKGNQTSRIEARGKIREHKEEDIKVEVMGRGNKVRPILLIKPLKGILEEVIIEEEVTKEIPAKEKDQVQVTHTFLV